MFFILKKNYSTVWIVCIYVPLKINFLVRTRSGDYKKCDDQSLREVMVQMDIESFVIVRAVRELLSNTIPDRKYIDRRMMDNVKFRARKK